MSKIQYPKLGHMYIIYTLLTVRLSMNVDLRQLTRTGRYGRERVVMSPVSWSEVYKKVEYGGREWPLKVKIRNRKSISKSENCKLKVDF